MPLPPALKPLRHRVFRMLWSAYVVVSLGTWLQNTGAGWLMTSLNPDPLVVSLVQAATIVPIFLLALPAGAIADIVDRRIFLLATQVGTLIVASVLAILTLTHQTTAGSLLGLTFLLGIGAAMTQPAWAAIVPELVPRADLVQAIALNGIGFNIARAIGPALAGALVLVGGAGLAFSFNAVSFIAVIGALLLWRPTDRRSPLPREHFLSAIRAGMRYVRNTPRMRSAMLRAFVFFVAGGAPWGLLPLIVREQLHLGAGMFGVILGLMGIGGISAGLLLPNARRRLATSDLVVACSFVCAVAIGLLAISRHWIPAAIGMGLFGLGWVAGASTLQASAQLVAPPWVRARALGIYQVSFYLGLAIGIIVWGWLAAHIGLPRTLGTAAVLGAVSALVVRGFALDTSDTPTPKLDIAGPEPEAPAPELANLLPHARGRVLESLRYRIVAGDRDAFLLAMGEVRQVRGRAGAIVWRLYEDVAHPDAWMEIWAMESWTDHLREQARLSDEDRAALLRACAFHCDEGPPPAFRYIAVEPPNRGHQPH